MKPSNAQPCSKTHERKTLKEWTIMVFCAGDNELSPMIVSQLKDLKDAGHHEDVNVLVYFDANEKGVPTRVYSINQNGRNCHSRRSYTYVDNLASDHVEVDPNAGPAAKELWEVLKNPLEKEAEPALSIFLAFCREQYRAKHYALVLVGHGMIVANDAFLPDEFPQSSITLKGLGKTIDGFGGNLELLGLHSCSMSAVEVAYELKGKAKYMIASEGPSYVQGWPYRKLLQKFFEFLDEPNGHNSHNGHNGQNGNVNHQSEPVDARHLMEGLYSLASSNGLDFTLSGYSQDLALINLDPNNFAPLTAAIEELVAQLKLALEDESCVPRQLIQLAHLESQSYFNESYTDLYDFCYCLSKSCIADNLKRLKAACCAVIAELEPNNSTAIGERFSKIVVRSTNFGSLYQHSHGLSVYFPWTQPLGDEKGSVLKRYKKYRFTKEFQKENSWRSFLKLYLKKTEREPRYEYESTYDENISLAYVGYGVGQLSGALESPQKTSGASGPSCQCASIKNFPVVVRTIKGKKCLVRELALSQELRVDQQEGAQPKPKPIAYSHART